MNRKISFHGMSHSDPLEKHAEEKLAKLEELVKKDIDYSPFFVEVWLKAQSQHPHHEVELHLKTPRFDLYADSTGTDMYVVFDETVDKMVELFKKEKEKLRDKQRSVETEKSKFNK